jgi:hypothetical protein
MELNNSVLDRLKEKVDSAIEPPDLEGFGLLIEALLFPDSIRKRFLIRKEFDSMKGPYTERVKALSKKHFLSESRIKGILTETGKGDYQRALKILEDLFHEYIGSVK